MIGLLLFWIVCAVLCYGVTFADFIRRYPQMAEEDYYKDMRFALLMSLGGPLTLLVALFCSCLKYGIKFK